jgi:hypothetical protein
MKTAQKLQGAGGETRVVNLLRIRRPPMPRKMKFTLIVRTSTNIILFKTKVYNWEVRKKMLIIIPNQKESKNEHMSEIEKIIIPSTAAFLLEIVPDARGRNLFLG